MENTLLHPEIKPLSAGTILTEEFLASLNLTQTDLAQRSGLPRKHVNEFCRDRRAITADTAHILARSSVTPPTSGAAPNAAPTSGKR